MEYYTGGKNRKRKTKKKINYWYKPQHKQISQTLNWVKNPETKVCILYESKNNFSSLTFPASLPYLTLPMPLTLKLHSGFLWHHVVLCSCRPLPLFPGVLVLYTSFLSPDPLGSAGRSSQQKSSHGVHTIRSQMTFRHCFSSGQGCAITCLLDSWLWTFSEHFQFSGFKHHPWFCSQT